MPDDGGGAAAAGGSAAGSAGSAGSASSDSPRAEMGDAPPFLSWRAIYLIVLGALAIEAALGVALTVLFR
jgi:hypothetical protein